MDHPGRFTARDVEALMKQSRSKALANWGRADQVLPIL
jgi:hypothetical protein